MTRSYCEVGAWHAADGAAGSACSRVNGRTAPRVGYDAGAMQTTFRPHEAEAMTDEDVLADASGVVMSVVAASRSGVGA